MLIEIILETVLLISIILGSLLLGHFTAIKMVPKLRTKKDRNLLRLVELIGVVVLGTTIIFFSLPAGYFILFTTIFITTLNLSVFSVENEGK